MEEIVFKTPSSMRTREFKFNTEFKCSLSIFRDEKLNGCWELH